MRAGGGGVPEALAPREQAGYDAAINATGTPVRPSSFSNTIRRTLVAALVAAAAAATPAVEAAAQQQQPVAPTPSEGAAAPVAQAFIQVIPTEGRAPVRVAAAQVVRVARAEGYTVIDTTAYVQQRTVETVEAVARRLAGAGQRMIALTDLRDARTYLAADRVVLVREPYEQHAAGARAAVVMVGLRFNTDVAVRETVEQVVAALERAAPPPPATDAPAVR